MLVIGMDVVPKGNDIVVLEKDMGDIFNIIIVVMTLGRDVNANMAEIPIGRNSFVGEEPKKGFDFVGFIGFPDFRENRMLRFELVIIVS